MVIMKEEDIRKTKILTGTAFYYRFGEVAEERWTNKLERKPEKRRDIRIEIMDSIQRNMRKRVGKGAIKGEIWIEDFEDIFTDVWKTISGDEDPRIRYNGQTGNFE